jgi:multiple sugar transport system permease protein
MVDVAFQPNRVAETRSVRKRSSLRTALKRKSTAAFLMTLPLILLVGILVLYPAFYSLHLATLNKSMQRFVGFGNFEFLFKRDTFWLVVKQSCIFALSAVFFKALIGFVVAHFVHNVPAKGQRKWRGMLLVPWVIPPAMSTLAWLWLFDPSYSAFNYTLSFFGIGPISWLGEPGWARFSVILVNVWYVTLPMMRNIIAITTLFSLIVTFANFDITRILTAGGPLDHTHIFATWAFRVGIEGSDLPLGASVSLFMVPILAIAAVFILRDINKRGNEA